MIHLNINVILFICFILLSENNKNTILNFVLEIYTFFEAAPTDPLWVHLVVSWSSTIDVSLTKEEEEK